MLLFQDGLERFDEGIGVDRQRVGDSDRQWHHPIELASAFEDHERPFARRLVTLEELLDLAQVLRHPEPLRVRQGIDERLSNVQDLVPKAAEDAEKDRTVRPDEAIGRKVQVEADHRPLIRLPRDAPDVLAVDEGSLREGLRERFALGHLFLSSGHGARRSAATHPPLALLDRLPGCGHRCSFLPSPLPLSMIGLVSNHVESPL